MADRLCSECGKSLRDRGPKAMTCGDKCRKERSRRIRDNNLAEDTKGKVARVVHDEVVDVAREAMKEELRPVVREALTEDAMRAIRDLMSLTAAAVDALREDLDGEDPVLRQRAATLVVKYTMGHPAIVKSGDVDDTKQIIVNFALPRPGAEGGDQIVSAAEIAEGEGVELRVCSTCGQEKEAGEFVEDSDRCSECHGKLRELVLGRVGLAS